MVLLTRPSNVNPPHLQNVPSPGSQTPTVTANQKLNPTTSKDRNLKSNPLFEKKNLEEFLQWQWNILSIDWDILGITEKDVFEQQKRERMEELQRKNEVARRGTEWIDQAPAQTAVTAPRRRSKKTEEKPKGEQQKLVNERKPIAKVFLSQEQLSVRKLVVEDKKSVFFTGSAGSSSQNWQC